MSLEELVRQASRHAPSTDRTTRHVERPLRRLLILRQDTPSLLDATLYEPVMCLILRGRKEVVVGERVLSFGPGECLLVSHDLPVRSRITTAPYLALVFEVDISIVRRLHEEVDEAAIDTERPGAAATQEADPRILDALRRYLELADSPADAEVLEPLISKELHYRLLVAPSGGMLRSLRRHDSNASAIARAIAQLRESYRSAVPVPDLARSVGMSTSSFHEHFKSVTSMTPLQYRQELRLLEARQLLKSGRSSVTEAAYEVGYESASQFSREYSRRFGAPPSRDIPDAARP